MALAAQGVAEAEIGQFQLGAGEVARLCGVGQNLAVRVHRFHALAVVLAQVGLFKAKEKVVGVLVLQAAHHVDGFAILCLAAEEERDGGARLNAGDDAAIARVAQHARAGGLWSR